MSDELKKARTILRNHKYDLQSDYIFYNNFSIELAETGKLNVVSKQKIVSEEDFRKDFETLKEINNLLPYSFFSENATTILDWAKEKKIRAEFNNDFDLLYTEFFRLLITSKGLRIEYNSKHISVIKVLKEYDFIFQVLNLYKICQDV